MGAPERGRRFVLGGGPRPEARCLDSLIGLCDLEYCSPRPSNEATRSRACHRVARQGARVFALSGEPASQGKAAFFQALGFSLDEWGVLQSALLEMAQNGLATPGQVSEFGTKYEIHGTIVGPIGRQAVIRTVWIIDAGEDYPRLVTAYPD